MLPDTGALVVDSVLHARGERAKTPVHAPWVTARSKTWATSSVVQAESEARNEDRVVLSSDAVSRRGERELAENEHFTEPEPRCGRTQAKSHCQQPNADRKGH